MNKKSFLLFETLISTLLLSFIIISSMKLLFDITLLHHAQKNSFEKSLDFTSAFLFIQKRVENSRKTIINENKIEFLFEDKIKRIYLDEKTLYFNESTLLENIKSFEVTKRSEDIKIKVCNIDDYCETWSIR